VLRLQEQRDIDHYKLSNYDLGYKIPILKIGHWGDGGHRYELDAIENYCKRGLFIG
jgi:hypothetical protein